MIGQLAASTMEVDDSKLDREQVGQEVMMALMVDSEG